MKTKELSSILVVGAILFIAPRPSSAQTDDFKPQYEDFKKQARVEYGVSFTHLTLPTILRM